MSSCGIILWNVCSIRVGSESIETVPTSQTSIVVPRLLSGQNGLKKMALHQMGLFRRVNDNNNNNNNVECLPEEVLGDRALLRVFDDRGVSGGSRRGHRRWSTEEAQKRPIERKPAVTHTVVPPNGRVMLAKQKLHLTITNHNSHRQRDTYLG